jgi:hypothetical protein
MNSTGGFEVISMKASGYYQPTRVGVRDINVTVLNVPAPSWAKTSFSFSRTIDGITGTSQYIYAYSSSKPKDIDNPNTPFHYHESTGSFSQDFIGTISKSILTDDPKNKTAAKVFQMHGVVMYIAWGFLPLM